MTSLNNMEKLIFIVFNGLMTLNIILLQVTSLEIYSKYTCFPQTYSTCQYRGYVYRGLTVPATCVQITNRIRCDSSDSSEMGCSSIGYSSNYCYNIYCSRLYDSSVTPLRVSVEVTLECADNNEYVNILEVAYILPTKRVNYCREAPNCSNINENVCVNSRCVCFTPDHNEICEQSVKINHDWTKTCNTSPGTCTISADRIQINSCSNLGYYCNTNKGHYSCYSTGIKIAYYCVKRDDQSTQPSITLAQTIPATHLPTERSTHTERVTSVTTSYFTSTVQATSGQHISSNTGALTIPKDEINIGIIAGVSVAVIALVSLALIFLIVFFRRKGRTLSNSPTKPDTFANNVYNEHDDTSCNGINIHSNSVEYAVVDKSQKSKDKEEARHQLNHNPSTHEDVHVTEMVDNTYYVSEQVVKDGNTGGNSNDEHHSSEMTISEDYEGLDDINPNNNIMMENTYYESECIGNKNNNAEPITKSQVDAANNMTENTYYESSNIEQKDITNKQTSDEADNEMVDNTYYQGDLGDNGLHSRSNDVIPNTYYESEAVIGTSGKQKLPISKFDEEENKEKDDEGNYMYTYGHFKLESRERAP